MVSGKVTQVIKDWSPLSLLQYAKKLKEMFKARNKRIVELEQRITKVRSMQNTVEFLLERINSNQLKVLTSLKATVSTFSGSVYTPKPEYRFWADNYGKTISCWYSTDPDSEKLYDYGNRFEKWVPPQAYKDLLNYFGGYKNG